MIGHNQRKWLDALRSGEYEQGYNYLQRDGKFCCLGVACEVFEVPKVGEASSRAVFIADGTAFGTTSTVPVAVKRTLGLRDLRGTFMAGSPLSSLASMNDSTKFTFSEIADIIEANPSSVFEEPK